MLQRLRIEEDGIDDLGLRRMRRRRKKESRGWLWIEFTP
jgi:hypothetical protein